MTAEGRMQDPLKTVSRAREKSFPSMSLSSSYYPLYNASTLQASCPRKVLCRGFRILGPEHCALGTATVAATSWLVNMGTWSSHLTLSAGVGLSLLKWLGWLVGEVPSDYKSIFLPPLPTFLSLSLRTARVWPFVL